MKYLKRLAFLCFLVTGISFSNAALAQWVDSQEHDDVVYFLFSTPNKIVRYDMATGSFLGDITLDKEPTSFIVSNGKAYVGFHRELREISLEDGADRFIRNTSNDIHHLTIVNSYIYVTEQSGNITTINASDFSFIETRDPFYTGTDYVGSNQQSAYYYLTRNDIRKVTLSADGTTLNDEDSPYHGDYDAAQTLYINESENRLIDNAGTIYFGADLTYGGNIDGPIDSLTFIGDNPIALRGEQVFLHNAMGNKLGDITLDHLPNLISGYNQTIYTFTVDNNAVTSASIDISAFLLPEVGETVDPTELPYEPEFIEHDAEDIVYIIDKESLSIFRWSTSQQTYLETWPLANPPLTTTYSADHSRLYFGYASGKITYMDTSLNSPTEMHFNSLATQVYGLLATGSYLFSADASGAWGTHYSFDINGVLTDSTHWRSVNPYYVWNTANSRIYYKSNLEWTELDQTTGIFGDHHYGSYSDSLTASYPLIVSNDGLYVLNGTGQIIDANSLSVLNALSSEISDGVWIDENLVTVKKGRPALQLWGENYELTSEFNLTNALKAHVFNLNNQLLLIQETNSGPSFSIFDLSNLPDSDEDGVHDLQDNCINEPNVGQEDYDEDNVGDACDADDDNDTISDETEINLGLNPQDSSDAEGDLDSDGYSNRLENSYGSKADDASSTPIPRSNYQEGFENGWPSGFYNSEGTYGWFIQLGGIEGEYSMRSSFFTSVDESAEINFEALFDAGVLTFQYRSSGNSYYDYNLEILLDGVPHSYGYHDDEWRLMSIVIPEGVHTITFRITSDFLTGYENESYILIDDLVFEPDSDGDGVADSIDNCPDIENSWQHDSDQDGIGNRCDNDPYNEDTDGDGYGGWRDNCQDTYNPDQADVDNDGIGDVCDSYNNHPSDQDSDGISDFDDNCVNVSNARQEDTDNDWIGDACDDDIDGDGITNEIEQQYSFLNEYDASDAEADHDGDGAGNLFEINSGTRPDTVDDHLSISLFDYHPLGEIEYIFAEGADLYRVTLNPTDQPGRYIVTQTDSEWTTYIEKRAEGIFLTEATYSDDTGLEMRYVHDNWLLLPSALILGESVSITSSVDFFYDGELTDSGVLQTQAFQLVEIGEIEWQGITYPSVTIKHTYKYGEGDNAYEYSEEEVYLKGIGLYSIDGYVTLDSATFNSITEEKEDESSGGSGALSWILLVALGTLISRRQLGPVDTNLKSALLPQKRSGTAQ